MRLILALLILSYSVSSSAQEESLFPELEEFTSSNTADDVVVEEATENITETQENVEDSINKEDLFQNSEPAVETIENKSEEPASKEDENAEESIFWTIADISATITPNPATSFCSAGFAVINMLKKELQEFSGTFTIGEMTKTFKFKNVGKGKSIGYKYMFVGTSCEQILNIPNIKIETCKVAGWPDKKCKEKVKYLQQNGSETTDK